MKNLLLILCIIYSITSYSQDSENLTETELISYLLFKWDKSLARKQSAVMAKYNEYAPKMSVGNNSPILRNEISIDMKRDKKIFIALDYKAGKIYIKGRVHENVSFVTNISFSDVEKVIKYDDQIVIVFKSSNRKVKAHFEGSKYDEYVPFPSFERIFIKNKDIRDATFMILNFLIDNPYCIHEQCK